jgi:hypothetical protein
MLYNLLDLAAVIRSFGRGVAFRAPVWDGASALNLTQLGDTEGDITIATNAEMATLTTPELTGPAAHETDYTGENPTIEMPLYLTDPATIALVSPSGTASAGRSRRSAPAEHTIAVLPEALFLKPPDVNGIVLPGTLSYTTANGWQFDGAALSAAKTTLLGASFWLWRAVFSRPPRRFLGGAGDARKNIETVTIQSMHHPDMPEGHHLYTIGNPATHGIDLEAGVAS